MYTTLHASNVKRSSSWVPHCTYSLKFLCLCPSVALSCKKVVRSFLQDSATDGHRHRNWRLYVRWGTPDDERLTLETCRVVYIWIENKNLSKVASVGLLIGILEYQNWSMQWQWTVCIKLDLGLRASRWKYWLVYCRDEGEKASSVPRIVKENSSSEQPDSLWGPHIVLFRVYQRPFVMVNRPLPELDHCHLVPKLRMHGAIPPPPSPLFDIYMS
jgi:hypothetical protein